MTFWDAVIVVGVAVLAIAVVEMYERWRDVMFPDQRNTHDDRRAQRIDTAAIAAAQEAKDRERWQQVFPPPAGPHGFDAQQDRRASVVPMTKRRLH